MGTVTQIRPNKHRITYQDIYNWPGGGNLRIGDWVEVGYGRELYQIDTISDDGKAFDVTKVPEYACW